MDQYKICNNDSIITFPLLKMIFLSYVKVHFSYVKLNILRKWLYILRKFYVTLFTPEHSLL